MAGAGWLELTARESAVLAAVGRRLNNSEIADEFGISVRTVESHIASLRRKLSADTRAALREAARSRRSGAVPLPHNSFVGRSGDTEVVRAVLSQERWVTVVGPAGSGKTRLALELAAADERTPVVAELEHATTADVTLAVARAIGLGADSAGELVAACGVALKAQPHLLVIDNCDRVTDAVADLVRTLLALAPSLTVLATSRSPIGGSDEVIHQLAPLPVDEDSDGSAVRLFLDRARSNAPLSAADEAAVTQICRTLDGLPLAIELAAARVRHLPLRELAARLDKGLGALDRAGPDDRHRTLEAAFDWTWDLLDDDERSVLSALAALPRTFDLELAEAVTRPGAEGVVLRLLDRSLVSRTAMAEEPTRFRLLSSLRAFVLGRTSSALVHDVRRAHASHHAALVTELARRARTDNSRAAAATATRLSPEAAAALDWALEHEVDLALPLTRALSVIAEQYGPGIDSLATIDRAARHPQVRRAATASDLLDIGVTLTYGDLDLVSELAEQALRIAGDEQSLLAAHLLAGTADAYGDRGEGALAHVLVAERLADSRLDMWHLAAARQVRGTALRGPQCSDFAGAIVAFESAMHTYALAGDAMHVNNARYMMAATAAQAGLRTNEALGWADDCLAFARTAANRHELGHALLTRAAVAPAGDHDAELSEATEIFRTVGDLRCLTRSYLRLADRRPPAEQVPLLEQALDVARTAHDAAHQATVLERLMNSHWAADAPRNAFLELGALIDLVGREQAVARCPQAMAAEGDRWDSAIAEGQARARRPTSAGVEPTGA